MSTCAVCLGPKHRPKPFAICPKTNSNITLSVVRKQGFYGFYGLKWLPGFSLFPTFSMAFSLKVEKSLDCKINVRTNISTYHLPQAQHN